MGEACQLTQRKVEPGSLSQLASALAYWHFKQAKAESWSSPDHPGHMEIKPLLS